MQKVQQDRRKWDAFKQAIISVIIGSVISILTVIFQVGIEYLQTLQIDQIGTAAGSLRYLAKWYTFNRS